MKKKLIIVGIATSFLGIGTFYAYTCNHDDHYCDYPNCTKNGYHEHYIENTTYHCEIAGCEITSPHTHGNNSSNNNNNNNYYHHGNNSHHRRSCHNH